MNQDHSASLHRQAYFMLQSMRGRPVAKCMRTLQGWQRLDRSAFERLHASLLRDALEYASQTVPLYRSGPWAEAFAHADPTHIDTWPVLERAMIRTRNAELHSTHKPIGTFYRHSSASTGEPIRVAWNPRGAAAGWANEHEAMLWHGIAVGGPTLLFWGYGNQAVNWIRNYRVLRTTRLTPDVLENATQYLLRKRPNLCVGLPSAIAEWARYVRETRPGLPEVLVPFLKLGGEQIYPFQREELQRHLGSRVVETYGCTEVGPIAAQCPSGSMHILATNVHIEIFRDGAPVSPGECGDIVATSLTNRAMPLVRCKVGDSGSISLDGCRCGLPYPVLNNLVGRAADLFLASNGSAVHGSILGAALDSILATAPLAAIRQVLFLQQDPLHWKVLVESHDGFDEATASKLASLVRDTCGANVKVAIERVDLVQREASGKFRYYRSLACNPRNAGDRQGSRQVM